MQHRSRFLGLFLALLFLTAACGGDDGGGSASSDDDTGDEAPTTTEASTPANPEGSFSLIRWQVDSENPPANEPTGLSTLRVWAFEPDCDDDEPCDLTVSGGNDGAFDPPDFPEADPIPDLPMTWDEDEELWSADEELGAYGDCRNDDGEYVSTDYTTMDEVDHTELAWDEDGERLVGTKTETYTLNDAGRANPECSENSDDVVSYRIVAIPTDQFEADVEDEVELADSYRQTREVYSVEGTDSVAVYDWRVNNEATEGDGSCGPDDCDASLTEDSGPLDPQPLELAYDDGELTATFEGVGSCSSNASIAAGGEPEILTEEGYDVSWELDVTPVTVEDDAPPILVGNGERIAEPTPEAAAQFPDDCASTETVGAYWYFVPEELVS